MKEEVTARREAMIRFDSEQRERHTALCGVDEAGRGPLAGDVYAAAVILPPDHGIKGLDDSKKLSERQREALEITIRERALAFCVASASVEEIERLNILGAALLAMKRAVEGLTAVPDYVLVDGNRLPELSVPCEAVVGGDACSATIAAASILAKTARDRYMIAQAAMYPQYGFERHKGYGTKAHREALKTYGPCPLHRPSFIKKLLP